MIAALQLQFTSQNAHFKVKNCTLYVVTYHKSFWSKYPYPITQRVTNCKLKFGQFYAEWRKSSQHYLCFCHFNFKIFCHVRWFLKGNFKFQVLNLKHNVGNHLTLALSIFIVFSLQFKRRGPCRLFEGKWPLLPVWNQCWYAGSKFSKGLFSSSVGEEQLNDAASLFVHRRRQISDKWCNVLNEINTLVLRLV